MLRLLRLSRPTKLRLVAALSLAGFLLATIGMPVAQPFVGASGKNVAKPFPCMFSRCGCQTAEGCWRSCCCHTNAEKLAWAKKNGVTPPDYVVAAAAKEAKQAVGCGSCCQARQKSPSSASKSEPTPAWTLGIIPSIAARKCQGLAQIWLVLSAAAPPAAPVRWSVELNVIAHSPTLSPNLPSYDLVPPTPPPKA